MGLDIGSMAGYKPLYISKYETGLVQNRENFLLPNDAYPILSNAYVWRERIKRKQGYQLLGRLQRNFLGYSEGPSQASVWSFNLLSISGFVFAADNENPGNITTTYPHGLVNGNTVVITGILGATGYNNKLFTITVVDNLNFTIGVDAASFGSYTEGGKWISNASLLTNEPNASIAPKTVIFTIGSTVFTDQGNGELTSVTFGNSGTINYITGDVSITHTAGTGIATTLRFSYYPGLPVMGLRQREDQNATFAQTIAFDQVYAYSFDGTNWQEFIPGTVWNAKGSDSSGVNFFWSTNYFVGDANKKIFWVTNYSGVSGDPIRYTNGIEWVDFAPEINGTMSPNLLTQCLCLLPFRGRLVAFNTLEGTDLASSLIYSNRIRWSAIGTPFSDSSDIVGTASADAWKDDIRGKGGFLDIPTSEDIVSVGFVRDNLVIYCKRSTWQLRYTGRSISPFQIEKVNSENGVESTFSAIQFDTSLVGIGDKGILECDSFKSELIDIKIPDFVFDFQSANNGPKRIQGIRDFINRLAYWTVPLPFASEDLIFPNQRLVYNYENDSWALFTDSLTCLGTIQLTTSPTWLNTHKPWIECNFPWISEPASDPLIIGGNQQGFVERLDQLTTNDISLYISDITPRTTTPTEITSPNHNLISGAVIQISDIPSGTPYANLNSGIDPNTSLPYNDFNGIYGIIVLNANTFQLMTYSSLTKQFSSPQLDVPNGDFIGVGNISVRDNFNVTSKKFNFLEEGKSIQMGYLDILMSSSEIDNPGAISMNVYLDYNDQESSNTLPLNATSDEFFNSTIPTCTSSLNKKGGTKYWQRVFCPTRANFLTIEYNFSNAQMAGIEQELEVQIDAQVLWMRPAGRLTQI